MHIKDVPNWALYMFIAIGLIFLVTMPPLGLAIISYIVWYAIKHPGDK